MRESKAYQRLLRKLTVENLWLYVLSLLKEKPRYVYEMRTLLKSRFGFEPGEVTSYVVFYKLRREGLITVKEIQTSGEGPSRKYYAITEKGEDQLASAESYLRGLLKSLFLKE